MFCVHTVYMLIYCLTVETRLNRVIIFRWVALRSFEYFLKSEHITFLDFLIDITICSRSHASTENQRTIINIYGRK